MKVTVKDLSFSYDAKMIIQDLSFDFDDERPLCVLGPSGQGKTTLLRLLAGLETPTKGTIEGITKDTTISVLFQEDRLFPHLTVRDNWKIVSSKITEEMILAMAKALDLEEEDLNKRPRDLSGGMRRRCAIGRCLLFPADMVFMDEPFQGLDEATRDKVMETIKKRTHKRPFLMITHDEKDVERLGAKVLRLEDPVETQK